jgi:hypothetical protein
MRFRGLLRTRDFHALWIGAVLLGLTLWFDVAWIGVLILMFIGFAALFIRWVVWLFTPPGDRNPDR